MTFPGRHIAGAILLGAFFTGCASDSASQKTLVAMQPVLRDRSVAHNAPERRVVGEKFVLVKLEREKADWCKVTVKNTGLHPAHILTPTPSRDIDMPPEGLFAFYEGTERGKKRKVGFSSRFLHANFPPQQHEWPRLTIPPGEEYVYRYSISRLLAGGESFYGEIPPEREVTIFALIHLVVADSDETVGLSDKKTLRREDW